MPTQEIKLLRMVYRKFMMVLSDIFPGCGPTELGIISDVIAMNYDGTIGEWALYIPRNSGFPYKMNFANVLDIRAKDPIIYAKVLIWTGDSPNPLHVEDVEIVQEG